VVNGLDVPVQVTIAGKPPFQLDAGARKSFSLREGRHAVSATTLDQKGRETDTVDVPRSGAAVYSVAGAAPLYVLTAFYSATPAAGRSHTEVLCGVRTFQRNVSYYFAEPPERITMDGNSAVKSSLLQDEGGWKSCHAMLAAEGKDRAAAEMMPAIRAMQPSDDTFYFEALGRWVLGEDEAALAVVRAGAKQLGGRDVHRTYAAFATVMGKQQELLREYQSAQWELPQFERRYLAARLLPAAESVKELQAMARERPEDTDVRLSLAASLLRASRFADATAALGPLGDGGSLEVDDRRRLLLRQVWALASQGRSEEAIEAIRAAIPRLGAWDGDFINTWGLLAVKMRRPDLEPDDKAIVGDAKGGRAEWRQVTYDGLVHPERLDGARIDGLKVTRSVAQLLVKAGKDPIAAVSWVRRMSSYEVRLIPDSQALVLWAEACRVGNQSAEEGLRHALLTEVVDFGALCAYVKEGRPTMEMSEVWEGREAVHLARSRALRARGDSAAAAAEEALVRKYDLYSGPATRALESWPSTAPGAASTAAGDVRLASTQESAPARRSPGTPIPPPPPPPKEHRLVRVEGLRLEPAP